MGKKKKEPRVSSPDLSSPSMVPKASFETGELCPNVLESSEFLDYFSALKGANLRSLESLKSRLNPELPVDLPPHPEPWENAPKIEYSEAFPTWSLLLDQGINILIYGVGSKSDLVTSFLRFSAETQNYSVLRVRGFLPSCTIRKILEGLMRAFNISLEQAPGHKDPEDVLEFFLAELDRQTRPEFEIRRVLLAIENIDGVGLLKPEIQRILSKLAASPWICLLATVDNPNISLLWNLSSLEAFNFLYAECPTFRPYYEELTHSKDPLNIFPKGSRDNEIRGVKCVLSSMTPTHRNILRLLAQIQQQQSTLQGITFKQLFVKCKEEMLLAYEKQLKEYLIEAKDHELIEERKDRKGQVLVLFKLPDEVVRLIANGRIYE